MVTYFLTTGSNAKQQVWKRMCRRHVNSPQLRPVNKTVPRHTDMRPQHSQLKHATTFSMHRTNVLPQDKLRER